jgi:hypothetical protein
VQIAVMEFQVVTAKRMPELIVGPSRIAVYHRKDVEAVSAGIEDRKTNTGRMNVSSVELTALDLLRYPHAAGALTISPRSYRISAARSTQRNWVVYQRRLSGRLSSGWGTCSIVWATVISRRRCLTERVE